MSEQEPEKSVIGDLDPSKWEEAVAVTGRPVDVPEENSTFSSRAKAQSKVVAEAENKAVAKKSAKRKS